MGFFSRKKPEKDEVYQEVRSVVLAAISDCIPSGRNTDEIVDKDRFYEELGLDPLDVCELLMDLEQRLAVNIPVEADDVVETVGQLVDYLSALVRGERDPDKDNRKVQ